MELGVGLPNKATRGHTITAEQFREYVRTADDYGFAGAWVTDHPVKPDTYRASFTDPLVTLAIAAGTGTSMELGTSVLLLPLRNPVFVATRVATLQHYSTGPVTLGVGQGYTEAEYDAAGVPFAERHARFTEAIRLLRELFTGDPVTFTGEFYHLDGFRLEPALTDPPRLLVGGGGTDHDGDYRIAESVKQRLLLGDGWLASSVRPIATEWDLIRSYLEAHDRNPDTFDIVAVQQLHVEPGSDRDRVETAQRHAFATHKPLSWETVQESFLTGTVSDITSRLEDYAAIGVDHLVLLPVVSDHTAYLRQLEYWKDHLLPAVG